MSVCTKYAFLFTIMIFVMPSCSTHDKNYTYVSIKTDLGKIVIKLYNDTPEHRDNFIKLVRLGFYDGLLFHRVIKDFMVQGGDPDSREAKTDQPLGSGGPGYTLPAEFIPAHFHKKGALAAARQGDNVNPGKKSSGSQFYIVTGQVFSESQLSSMEQQMNHMREETLFQSLAATYRQEIMQYKTSRNQAALAELQEKLIAETKDSLRKEGPIRFTPEQKEVYMTVGGAPHLDGSYTVFGEVVEGFDVLDKIQSVPTRQGDRPDHDIKMSIKVLE